PRRPPPGAPPPPEGGGPPPPAGRPEAASAPPTAQAPAVDPAAALQRMYVDTSPCSSAHLSLNAEVLGPERMLFGTDSPPLAVPLEEQIRMIEKLPIDRASQQLVLGGNAEAVFDLRSRP
ncbi:amidohydrolase family protein, partial [Streptomyces sp. NPDC091215]|uniref:amidohydrolase family protein n=1 Tax=Streptomyces sp. NPDC091215 TaxID=3155192 RepID=UPI00341963EC